MDIEYAKELYKKTQKTEPSFLVKFLSEYILFRIKVGLEKDFSRGKIDKKKTFDYVFVFTFLTSEDNEKLAKIVYKKLKEFYPHILFSYLGGQIYEKGYLLATFENDEIRYTEYEDRLKVILKNFNKKKKYRYDSLVKIEIKNIERYIKKAIRCGDKSINIVRQYKDSYENVGYTAMMMLTNKGFTTKIYPIGNMAENKYSIDVSGWAK